MVQVNSCFLGMIVGYFVLITYPAPLQMIVSISLLNFALLTYLVLQNFACQQEEVY